MPRETLPNRRSNYSFTILFQGERYDVTIGHYADGRTGEVFINRILGKASAKVGTLLDGVCRDSAVLLSIAIQHGTDLTTIRHAVTRDEDGTPSTIVGAIVDHLSQEDPDDHNDNPRPRSGPPTDSPDHSGSSDYTIDPRDRDVSIDTTSPISITPGSERSWEDISYSYLDTSRD